MNYVYIRRSEEHRIAVFYPDGIVRGLCNTQAGKGGTLSWMLL